MTITFTAPDQEEYLGIVSAGSKTGIRMKKVFSEKRPYNGKCCITGVRQDSLQFINWLEGY